jgi:hypothetical protein
MEPSTFESFPTRSRLSDMADDNTLTPADAEIRCPVCDGKLNAGPIPDDENVNQIFDEYAPLQRKPGYWEYDCPNCMPFRVTKGLAFNGFVCRDGGRRLSAEIRQHWKNGEEKHKPLLIDDDLIRRLYPPVELEAPRMV